MKVIFINIDVNKIEFSFNRIIQKFMISNQELLLFFFKIVEIENIWKFRINYRR